MSETQLKPSAVDCSAKEKSYWEERLRENWGLGGVGYLGHGVPYNKWLYAVRKRVVRRCISELPVTLSSAKVLDIGSGTGFWLDVWRELGARSITGTDITTGAVDRLRAAYPEMEVFQMDIAGEQERVPIQGDFDLVSAFDVLFHITDDNRFRRAVVNIASVLAPGGYLVFSDNFVHGAAVRVDHQVSRPLKEIEDALAANGLNVVRRAPMFVVMNAPIDSSARWAMFAWRGFLAPVHLVPVLGHIYGACLFPIELFLTQVFHESPTTEMMICRKV